MLEGNGPPRTMPPKPFWIAVSRRSAFEPFRQRSVLGPFERIEPCLGVFSCQITVRMTKSSKRKRDPTLWDLQDDIWQGNIFPWVGEYNFLFLGLVCKRMHRMYAVVYPEQETSYNQAVETVSKARVARSNERVDFHKCRDRWPLARSRMAARPWIDMVDERSLFRSRRAWSVTHFGIGCR